MEVIYFLNENKACTLTSDLLMLFVLGDGNEEYGFIAQQLQSLSPQLVKQQVISPPFLSDLSPLPSHLPLGIWTIDC